MNSLSVKISFLFLFTLLFALGIGLLYTWNQQQDLIATVEQLKRSGTFIEKPPGAQALLPALISEDSQKLSAQIAELQQTIATLEAKIENQPTTTTPTTTNFTNFPRQVLYLGSAESTQRDWTRTNLEITLNSADYPTNVEVIFEAGLSIIGGEASARLVNISTGAMITASEVKHGSSTVSWKSSSAFKLHPGQNVYAVELRSSSQEKAQLSGARIILQ